MATPIAARLTGRIGCRGIVFSIVDTVRFTPAICRNFRTAHRGLGAESPRPKVLQSIVLYATNEGRVAYFKPKNGVVLTD